MDTSARHGWVRAKGELTETHRSLPACRDECGDGDIFETPWVGSHQCVDGGGAAGVPHLQPAAREKTAQRERGNRHAMTAMGRGMMCECVVCCCEGKEDLSHSYDLQMYATNTCLCMSMSVCVSASIG